MNRGHEFKTTLSERANGATLLDWLSSEHPHSTRGEWRSRIEEGRVTLDGRRAEHAERLRRGQTLTWARPPWTESEVPLHYQVVYQDEHLLVVDKPSGLPTMPGGGFHDHTLLTLVRARDRRWSPVHRLGRGTALPEATRR